MTPHGDRLASRRRIVDMSEPVAPWTPDLPPTESYEQDFPVSRDVYYIQRIEQDERGRLCEWAVMQMHGSPRAGRLVVVYDTCHGKGIHGHFHDEEGQEVEEVRYRDVNGYDDLESGLDWALNRVTARYEENYRRWGRGQ